MLKRTAGHGVQLRFALALLVALSSAACGTGTALNYIQTNEPPRAMSERGPQQVDVFMTTKPDRPFVEVGIVESQQESMSLDDEQAVIGKMRRFAGEHGCHALVIFSGNDATYTSGSNDVGSSRVLKGYRASCLVYTGPRPTRPAAPAAAMGCMPNSTQVCYGPGGCRGGQRCNAEGNGYTLCDCGGGPTAQER